MRDLIVHNHHGRCVPIGELPDEDIAFVLACPDWAITESSSGPCSAGCLDDMDEGREPEDIRLRFEVEQVIRVFDRRGEHVFKPREG